MAKSEDLYDHPRSKASRGEQVAKKGDRQRLDKTIKDGPDEYEFSGEYESVGFEGRKEGDPDSISTKDRMEMSEDDEKFRKGGKKGPVPSFKAVPKEGEGKDETGRDRYEIWRRRKGEIPTS